MGRTVRLPMSFTAFSFPTRTLFGAGALSELPAVLARHGVQRPLVVTDPGLVKTTAYQQLAQVLGADALGQKWFLCSGVHPNPIESDVKEAAEAFVANHCDGVIAIGGGSPLDAGKAARLLVKRPGFDLGKFYDEPDWSGMAPFIAIPTTAGTGSEVGRSSVITLDATHRKAVLFHPEMLAKTVILDPELTCGLPPKLTAATGADALTHCIESYTCPAFHPMCDGIALEGVRLIVEALPKAYRDGGDNSTAAPHITAPDQCAEHYRGTSVDDCVSDCRRWPRHRRRPSLCSRRRRRPGWPR